MINSGKNRTTEMEINSSTALLEKGREKFQQSQYHEAAKYFTKYVKQHKELDGEEHLLEALLGLGRVKYNLAQYYESANYFIKYVEQHKELDGREGLLEALLKLGNAKYKLSQYDECAEYMSMYVEMHTELDSREDLLEALLGLGVAKNKFSQYEESAKYFSQYVEVHTEVDSREDFLNVVLWLGRTKDILSQYDESAKYYLQYVEVHTEADKRENLIEALLGLGFAKYQLSQYEESAKYYSRYLEVHTKVDRREWLLDALLRLGVAKYALSQYEESAKYCSQYVELHTQVDFRENLLQALLMLGGAKYLLLQYEESAKYFSQYVEVHTEIDSREHLLQALHGLGGAKYALSQYEESAKYFSMYIERHTYVDRRENLLEALLVLGGAKSALSQFEESAKYLSQYVKVHTKFDSREGLLEALLRLGEAKYTLSQYEESAKYFLMYIERRTEVDSRESLFQALLRLGQAKYALLQYEESDKYFSMYIERHTYVDKRKGLLEALLWLGDTKLQKRDYNGAIYQFEKYLSIADDSHDEQMIMKKYHDIGLCYSRREMWTQSVEWLENGLSLAQQLNDMDLQVKISGDLSWAFFQKGENERSISLLNSVKDDIDSDETFKKKPTNYARFLFTKSLREFASGLLDEAYDTALRASSLSKGDVCLRVDCLLHLALISVFKELYDTVKTNLDEVLLLCERLAGIEAKARALCIYAFMYLMCNQYNMAREKVLKLLETASNAGNKEMQFEAHHELGYISGCEGNSEEAERCFQEMVKLIPDLIEHKYKKEQFEYFILTEAVLNGQRGPDVIEKLMNILLTDLQESPVVSTAYCDAYWRSIRFLCKMTDDLNTKEGLFNQTIYSLQKSLLNNQNLLKGYGKQDDHRISALQRFIDGYKVLAKWLIDKGRTDEAIVFADRGRMCILQDILREKYCMAVADESENEKLDLKGIQDIAVKETCSIVFYLMLEECLMIWIISEKSIECEKVTKFVCEESELLFERETDPAYYLGKILYHLDDVGQASVFREAASKDSENVETTGCGDEDLMIPESTDSEYHGEAGDEMLMSCNQFELLYDWLIAPIEDKLTEDKILIIPDNFMFQIPFIALKDKKTGKHLADMKIVRLAPSLMTLQILKDPASSNKHSQGGALVVAADDVGKVKYKGKEKIFPRLEYAAKEAEKIGEKLKVDPLIGRQATKRAVVEQLSGDYKVLHIAAHGIFPGKIILTPNDTSTGGLPRQDDYMLHMSDVMKIGVRAQLVVLSCCSSGDGRQTAEGIIGFGRAFLAAGARAVLVALWNLKDRVTFLLMEKFYQCFVDGKNASDSLSEAVRALKSIEEYKHEKLWGPYVLLGGEVYWNEREPGLFYRPFSLK